MHGGHRGSGVRLRQLGAPMTRAKTRVGGCEVKRSMCVLYAARERGGRRREVRSYWVGCCVMRGWAARRDGVNNHFRSPSQEIASGGTLFLLPAAFLLAWVDFVGGERGGGVVLVVRSGGIFSKTFRI